MEGLRFKLEKSKKIKKKKHFEFLFKNAIKIQNSFLKIYYIKFFDKKRKCAFIASNYLGNAVKRNTYKRRLREIFRLNQHIISEEYDFAFIAKNRLLEKNFDNTNQVFISLLKANNLIKE